MSNATKAIGEWFKCRVCGKQCLVGIHREAVSDAPRPPAEAAPCQHDRAKRLRREVRSPGEQRALPSGGRAECWCCGEFVEEIVLCRSFNICKVCWDAAGQEEETKIATRELGVWDRRKRSPSESALLEAAREYDHELRDSNRLRRAAIVYAKAAKGTT